MDLFYRSALDTYISTKNFKIHYSLVLLQKLKITTTNYKFLIIRIKNCNIIIRNLKYSKKK